MTRKTGLSADRHREIGLELARLRDRLLTLTAEIAAAYPKSSRAGRLTAHPEDSIDKLRIVMENRWFAENPDATDSPWFPSSELRRSNDREPTWEEARAAFDAAEPVEVIRPPRRITVRYHLASKVYVAGSPEIPGFWAYGDTLDEVMAVGRERLASWLDPAVEIVEELPDGGSRHGSP